MEPALHLKSKSETFVRKVVSDPRWRLEDELLCQVLGFTLHGYLFGIGRIHCFMNVEDIHVVAIDQLAGIGIGRKYVEGMIQAAYQEFIKEKQFFMAKSAEWLWSCTCIKRGLEYVIAIEWFDHQYNI